MRMLGVPLPLWGVICLAVAGVWVFVWPSKTTVKGGPRFFILRWFHTLVWLLLGVAAFVAGFDLVGGAGTARVVALLSLATYLVFMLTVVTAKRR